LTPIGRLEKRTSASGLHNRIYDEHAPKREGLWKIEEPEIAAVFEAPQSWSPE
jgi:hypothetical protein